MADKYIVRTDIGKISVYDNTIREIVAGAAESVSGRAYITNSRGKQARRSSERLKDIEVDVADGRIFVRVYIVIKFGLSIHYVTDKLINGIRDGIHTLTGQDPKQITVVVAGVMSVRFAKRDIEIKVTYDD